MAAISLKPCSISTPTPKFNLPFRRTQFCRLQSIPILTKSESWRSIQNFPHLGQPVTRAKSDDFFEEIEKEESLGGCNGKPVKFLLWVFLWASVSIGLYAFSGDDKAAAESGTCGLRVGPKRPLSLPPQQFR